MKIINKGTGTAYVPGDEGTIALKPGKSVDVRLGVADYAVRNVPGVEFADADVKGLEKGVSEARVEAAVVPIAEHVTKEPGDVGYVVDGQASGGQTEPHVGSVEVHEGVKIAPVASEVVVTPAAPVSDGVSDLRGDALDEALATAGLSKSGTADEKRARYAEHLAAQAAGGSSS